jgi:exonuclease SbcC
MIPIKIQIKNFLSYGNELQTIDFSPYHLLCLSGKNGHGKSALLDAITWAIWGQARKTSNTAKADHGLLRLGQTHMLVILDFECNNIHYRIRREFALTYGKPYAAIDFGIIDEEHDTVRPLTEKTIRGTQQKIEETIHLDYDAFINSAFLRQGQSNEFSKKSAKDRKEILANILGLQRYEQMRKVANDASRQAAIEKQQLLAAQAVAAAELEKTDAVQQLLSQTQEQLSRLATEETSLASLLTKLQSERDFLVQKQEVRKRIATDITDTELLQEQMRRQLRSVTKEWRTVHAQYVQADSIDALKIEHVKLTQLLLVQQEAYAKKLEKKEIYLKEKEQLTLLNHALKTKHQEDVHAAVLTLQQQQLSYAQETEQLAAAKKAEQQLLATLAATEKEHKQRALELAAFNRKELQTHETQFEKRRTHYQQWIAQANVLKQELDQLKQKKLFTQEDDESSSCPLCEQNLSASRKKFLKSKISYDEHAALYRYNRLGKLITSIKSILIAQNEKLTALKATQAKAAIDEHHQIVCEQKIAELKQTLTLHETGHKEQALRIDQLHKAITEQEKKCATLQASIEQAIKSDPSYISQDRIVLDAEQAYQTIIYDAQAHQTSTTRLQQLTEKLNSYTLLQEDIAKQQERKHAVTELCRQLKDLKLRLDSLNQQLKEFASLHELTALHATKEQELRSQFEAITKHKELLLQEKGKHVQHLAMLEKLRSECSVNELKIKQLNETSEDYQAIASAFGKNGIQALLIEDAIPEIEQEANELLGKLTDNQAHIFIESLRDLKSGGTAETLDIKISDAAGIRAYELFSGGEAFRIDFALRIAISKLLARRAGTSLQTLIIDEGFGSQDEDGLSYIMDALYKIQQDFKKVIIVSHLPRMKDQFPVHFFVQKGPSGSLVRIIEQA